MDRKNEGEKCAHVVRVMNEVVDGGKLMSASHLGINIIGWELQRTNKHIRISYTMFVVHFQIERGIHGSLAKHEYW